jgi:hypothetical protein
LVDDEDEDEDEDEAMEEEVMGGAGEALGEDDDVGSGGGLDVPDMDDAGEVWMWDACIGVDGRVSVCLGESVAVCRQPAGGLPGFRTCMGSSVNTIQFGVTRMCIPGEPVRIER